MYNSGQYNGSDVGSPLIAPAGAGVGIPYMGGPAGTASGTATGGIPFGTGAAGTDPGASTTVYPDTVEVGGVALMCAVDRGTRSGQNTKAREWQDAAYGAAPYVVHFADDPEIDRLGTILLWTTTVFGPLRRPVTLRTLGAAEPPGGGAGEWLVSCERRS